MRQNCFLAVVATAILVVSTVSVHATPYASGVTKTGTSVSFILNEPTDTLKYIINGGAPVSSGDGLGKGPHSFTIPAGATFSIVADKTAATGYLIPTGNTIPVAANGLSQVSNEVGFNLISSDAATTSQYNSPRGVAVSNNPNAPAFGSVYISNSTAGTIGSRTLGDGMYAIRADQSDAFGYGNTAQDPNNKFDGVSGSANSPFRVAVAANGEVYVSDFSDANGNVWRLNSNLTTNDQVLNVVGGPTSLPAGSTHGSVSAAYVEGSLAGGNLTLWTLDEDLTTNVATGSGSTTDKNSLWRYNINSGPLPFAGVPTKVNTSSVLVPLATSDLDRGADGKFYLAQFRSAGFEAGVVVLNADGTTAWNSLTVSIDFVGGVTDIMRNVQAIAVSPDQKWLAAMLNNSDVAVLPLVNGIPDLANRFVVDTGTDVISGRDIAFDAAGNIHYVSSGQGLYRVLSPGGHTVTSLTWDGTQYLFNSQRITSITGDYNNDGRVDGIDYSIWRKTNSGGPSGYNAWRANFGTGVPGSGSGSDADSVPEPITLSSVLVGTLLLCFCRKATRRNVHRRRFYWTHAVMRSDSPKLNKEFGYAKVFWKSAVIVATVCLLSSRVFAVGPTLTIRPGGTFANNNLNAAGQWVWNVYIDPDLSLNTNAADPGTPVDAELGFTFNTNVMSATVLDVSIFDTPNPGKQIFTFESNVGCNANGNPCGIQINPTGNKQVFAAVGSRNLVSADRVNLGPDTVGGSPDRFGVPFMRFVTAGPSVYTTTASDVFVSGAYSGKGRITQISGWDGTSYTGASFDLFAGTYTRTAKAGDANMDGFVDVADFNIWYANVGNSVTPWYNGDFNDDNVINAIDYDIWLDGTLGDFNSNGIVDAADYVAFRKNPDVFDRTVRGYSVWRAHFSQSVGSGAGAIANTAVPEPATLTLLIIAAGSIRLRRRHCL